MRVLVAVTVCSFHTVCLIYAMGLAFGTGKPLTPLARFSVPDRAPIWLPYYPASGNEIDVPSSLPVGWLSGSLAIGQPCSLHSFSMPGFPMFTDTTTLRLHFGQCTVWGGIGNTCSDTSTTSSTRLIRLAHNTLAPFQHSYCIEYIICGDGDVL